MISDAKAEQLRLTAHLYGGQRGNCADNHPGEPCGKETVMCRRWSADAKVHKTASGTERLGLILNPIEGTCRCGCEKEVVDMMFINHQHRRQLLDILTRACERGLISLEQAKNAYADQIRH